MATPRHRTKTARRRRRIPLLIALGASVVAIAAFWVTRTLGGGDRPDVVAGGSDVTVESDVVTTSSSPSSTTTLATLAPLTATVASTTTSTSTTTTVAPRPEPVAGSLQGWYAIVQSGPKEGTNREALADAVAEYGNRGHVIDTDDFRTGDGLAPGYLPRAGILAAVVGSFGSFDDARAWCAQAAGGGPCSARQLIPA
jgi:hypothetical protein